MEAPIVPRRGADDDQISGLPDTLLHTILLRLASTAAATRNRVLSRPASSATSSTPSTRLSDPAPRLPSTASRST
uniref:F-box domain-containing protein n=1 Tax=Setaria viridis TaxID=4556 RepID=A0A4U6VIM5_SETVI|nr:hypothetical protein SEVIR_3G314403v2 [Setaria viridis]